ncbi:MAG TPA: ABC transporter permease subunit [Geminicoccus sp.]|uniref:ABC transporter permease subunit n=1 Tax=Geminicoccus sp. TaxID=2024832 RepID=UPI002E348C6A|nr:ABC transporter permease subunit [Geminicoccus sp.]HEX2528622.1 ABC transporter permease subunit [Geminicoccus sp.]
MTERTPILDLVTQLILILGLLLALAPLWLVFVAATLDLRSVNSSPLPILPGPHLFENLQAVWVRSDLGPKMANSLLVATLVAGGKVFLAALTAFSIVFFRWKLRMVVFWGIFVTLMLPLEVRIVPTYAVAANALGPLQTILDVTGVTWLWQSVTGIRLALEWNLLNSYTGLILPLVATATGTFLYRQYFLTIPDELLEAARMDGAGPLRFFKDVLIPLSRTNMAALSTIMFLYAWNQYLWPTLVTTDRANYGTATMELRQLIPSLFSEPEWHIAMAGTLIVMTPPLLVVMLMQRWFVAGLIAPEK